MLKLKEKHYGEESIIKKDCEKNRSWGLAERNAGTKLGRFQHGQLAAKWKAIICEENGDCLCKN